MIGSNLRFSILPKSLQHVDRRSWEQTHWPLWFLGDLSDSCLPNKGDCSESRGRDRWFVIFHKDACEPAVFIIHVIAEQPACDQMELTVFQKRYHFDSSFSSSSHFFFFSSILFYIYTVCRILLILTKKHTVSTSSQGRARNVLGEDCHLLSQSRFIDYKSMCVCKCAHQSTKPFSHCPFKAGILHHYSA